MVDSVACARPHSNMNVCRHRIRYCCCWFLSCTRTAIAIPDSTSIAVSTGSTCLSPHAFTYVKSTCITGCLLACLGRLSALPLLLTHLGHHERYGKCVSRVQAFLVLLVVVAPSFLWRVALVEVHLHCPCRTRICIVPLPRSLLIQSIVCRAVLLLIRASCH